jgi:hypothetical protein
MVSLPASALENVAGPLNCVLFAGILSVDERKPGNLGGMIRVDDDRIAMLVISSR